MQDANRELGEFAILDEFTQVGEGCSQTWLALCRRRRHRGVN
jgi:hypothetical protein